MVGDSLLQDCAPATAANTAVVILHSLAKCVEQLCARNLDSPSPACRPVALQLVQAAAGTYLKTVSAGAVASDPKEEGLTSTIVQLLAKASAPLNIDHLKTHLQVPYQRVAQAIRKLAAQRSSVRPEVSLFKTKTTLYNHLFVPFPSDLVERISTETLEACVSAVLTTPGAPCVNISLDQYAAHPLE